jgi:hypothetical protein
MSHSRTFYVLAVIGFAVISNSDHASGQSAQRQQTTSSQFCPPVQPQYCPPVTDERAPVQEPWQVHPPQNGTIQSVPVPDPGANSPSPPESAPTADITQDSAAQNAVTNQPNFAQPQINNALANVGDTGSRGSRAPNMIGDFFGTGSSGIVLGTSVQLDILDDFFAPVSTSFLTATDLQNGIPVTLSGGFSAEFTALENIGDLITAGDSDFADALDLNPLVTSISIGSNQTLAEIQNAINTNGVLTPSQPLSIGQIRQQIRNAILTEEPGFADHIDDLDSLVEIRLNELQSELQISGGIATPTYVYDVFFTIPTPNPGDLVGRFAIGDNNSPNPRDRFFTDYNYFHNARFGPAKGPLNRLTVGFEKTFADGNASVELRLPMAVTLSSNINTDGDNLVDAEFGNAGIAFKNVVYRGATTLATVGVGMTLPTADDFNLGLADDTQILKIANDSIHLLPYFAFLWQPEERQFFFQSFTSVDTDLNGNRVFYNSDGVRNGTGGTLSRAGVLSATDLIKFDNSLGYWAYRNQTNRTVTDLAFAIESHVVSGVGGSDVVEVDRVRIGEGTTPTIHNMSIGSHMHFGQNSVLTAGYGFPVTKERVFDGELRIFWNRYF